MRPLTQAALALSCGNCLSYVTEVAFRGATHMWNEALALSCRKLLSYVTKSAFEGDTHTGN